MTRITLYAHPFAPCAPEVFEVASLAHWLLAHFGPVPKVKVQVYTGQPSAETEITDNIPALMAGAAPEYTVLQSPGGFDPFTWFLIGLVLSAGAMLLMPKPEMPGAAVNRTQASPNNALGNRENKVRLLERVEDIYGTVKSIPSLMMPTYSKYIDHKKFEYGYYCISRGYCSVAELRDGDTLISDISGASASVYHPFASPNSGTPAVQVGNAIIDNIITAARSIEVDGITLQAPNRVKLPASAVYTFNAGGTVIQAAKQPNINTLAAVGDSLTITMSNYSYSGSGAINVSGNTYTNASGQNLEIFAGVYVGDTLIFSGFANAANNGSFVVTSKVADSGWNDNYSPGYITVSGSHTDESAASVTFASATSNYSGTYTIAAVGDGTATLSGTSWSATLHNVTCSVQLTGLSEYTDWITLPDLARTQVWCNVTAPNGIYFDQAGNKLPQTVTFEIQIEKLNPTTLAPLGIVETVSGSLTGQVTDERADTIEHATAWAGPARVRMRRTSDFPFGASGTVIDEIKWADLYSITPVSKPNFGNKTTVHTVTQATARATAVKTRQLNCLATRLLPTYNGAAWSATLDATGLKTSGTLAASSKMIDIIAAVAQDPKIGARTLGTDIDLPQIWAVQQALDAWHPECGQFNFTFDSDNTSFEETLILIANAAFCIAYRQNGKIRLAFDRAQTASTALFTHRNKKPKSETITRSFASDSDYDGVQFTYVDPDTETNETISLPLDGSATKYKKFELAGVRSYTQAWYRASREYAKLRGQRLTLETTTTLDARALLPNSRIDVVDNTRFKTFDGEVVGQSGLTLTLSQDVAFVPAAAHSIILMRRDGSLQSIACTAGPAPNQVVLASTPAEAIVTSYGADGIRTIFSFAANSARAAQAWLVQEIDMSDGQYCQIRAINYSADYYASDTAAVPVKATVIN